MTQMILFNDVTQEEDTEAFEDKMGPQFSEGIRLEAEIRKNLAGLGYEFKIVQQGEHRQATAGIHRKPGFSMHVRGRESLE